MKWKQLILFGITLLIMSGCRAKSPGFIVHYVGLEDYEGDTANLWQLTADMMKSDRDYGKGAIASAVVANGQITFTGKEDTLHMYEIEIQNSSRRFYPERGELTLTHVSPPTMPVPDKSTNPHSLNETVWKLWHEEGFSLDKTRRLLFATIQNAVGCFLLDRYAVVYPNELEDLYNRTNEKMRDTVSVLLNLRKQLQAHKAIQKNEFFVDFRQITFERDTLQFSDVAGKGKPTCLLFWMNANETIPIKKELDSLKKQYPSMQLVVAALFYPDPQSQLFMQELKEQYGAMLVDDGRRFENSVRWLYRIHSTNFNYEYLFDEKGNLIKQQPLMYPPNGWYVIEKGKEDTIGRIPIVTVSDFSELRLDSFIHQDETLYQIIGCVKESKRKTWADTTEVLIGKSIGFIYNGQVVCSPVVNCRIESGNFAITTNRKQIYYELLKESALSHCKEAD